MTKEEILNMPAGREMDALVAEKVMRLCVHDWTFIPNNDDDGGVGRTCQKCHKEFWGLNPPAYGESYGSYSTDISAAWEVVETLRERQIPIQIRGDEWYDGGGWIVEIMDVLGEQVKHKSYIEVTGPNRGRPNVCLAICRAALLTTTYRQEQEG